MHNAKKWAAAAALLAILCLGGCQGASVSTSQSMTFQVGTGDKIKVTLDTSAGDSLAQEEGSFSVKNGDSLVFQGVFQTPDQYAAQEAAIRGTEGVEIVTDGETMLSYYHEAGAAGPETGYLFMVDGSDTGVYMASLMDREAADDAFGRMTFEKE